MDGWEFIDSFLSHNVGFDRLAPCRKAHSTTQTNLGVENEKISECQVECIGFSVRPTFLCEPEE